MQQVKKQYEVTMEDTAIKQGSGDVFVLSTPRLVAYMENTAKQMLDEPSVGYQIDIRHKAPTPQGALITVECGIIARNGKRITFKIKAFDCLEEIAEAVHVRVLIDPERFQEKVDRKMLPN